MAHHSIITRIEELLSEIDKLEGLANRGVIDWWEACNSVDRFTPRLEALLPRKSHAYRIFWSRAQLSPVEFGFERDEQVSYLE